MQRLPVLMIVNCFGRLWKCFWWIAVQSKSPFFLAVSQSTVDPCAKFSIIGLQNTQKTARFISFGHVTHFMMVGAIPYDSIFDSKKRSSCFQYQIWHCLMYNLNDLYNSSLTLAHGSAPLRYLLR